MNFKCSATEHFNYDPKANLSNGSTQSHAVFTCHTAALPFVQTLSPSHKAGMLSAVTCDKMHHMLFCMGHLWIAPTVHIQQRPLRQLVTNPNCFVFRCCALYALSGGSPAFVPRQRPMLVMLADKHTRNACLLSYPSDHVTGGVPAQDAPTRTPLWSTMIKVFPSRNGPRDPKQADGNNSGRLALSTIQWSLHSSTRAK
ncbi:hypothetical protein O181_064892 [Austropuccinia psidii MF-1]|uniref:Uncharacterized protein n=1 Tax=Austropuccinia psidii MF-1 TaxID=1389203 RepID=A0A9Q3I2T6_9BASI|nr:hypothetical protein [Austropuccinia psidii MF-1]